MPESPVPGPGEPAPPNCQDPVPLVPAPSRPGRKPLPDAQAIISIAVPEFAPPFDDAAAAGDPARPVTPRPLASVRATGDDRPARTAGPARKPGPVGPRPAGPQQAEFALPGARLPGTGGWPSQFAQVLAETLAGSRPATQIVPWTTEQARRRISQLGPMLATAHSPRVRRVIVTSPAAGIVEMTIVVAMGAQVRAVAVRLERPARSPGTRRPAGQAGAGPDRSRGPAGGGWLCTAVEAA